MKLNSDYKQWLTDLKSRIRQSQIKAAVKVNTELLRLYWDLGQDIVARQMETTWGSGFFEQLSKDLRNEFPNLKGFSMVNLTYCKRLNLQQVVEEIENHPIFQIHWGHNILIFTKTNDVKEAFFYVQKTIENNWSRDALALKNWKKSLGKLIK